MKFDSLYAVSFDVSMSEAVNELLQYFSHMSVLEWGIVSSSAVLFGFLCMRSQDLRN